MTTNSTAIFHYHNRTKHQFNAYAKAPEFLDWDEQPNPFRRFGGCETVELPLLKAELVITNVLVILEFQSFLVESQLSPHRRIVCAYRQNNRGC
jgi:hypothetical protein